MEDMMYNLKQALFKETIQDMYTLSNLVENFYQDCNSIVDTDLISTLNTLIRIRHSKILLLSNSPEMDTNVMSKLTCEELQLYKDIYSANKSFRNSVLNHLD